MNLATSTAAASARSSTRPAGATAGHKSMAEMFLDRVEKTPSTEAYRSPDGAGWKSLTWKEVGVRVRALACGLRSLGLGDEERVAILSGTRMDWILADLAVVMAGGATTTIYPSNTPDDCSYIINDSAAKFVFAENADQVKKLVQKRAELTTIQKVIVFDGAAQPSDWVLTLSDLEEKGRAADAAQPARYEQIARAIRPESLATLIYTSGTTGKPKGVELTHDCWVYEGEAIAALGLLRADDFQYLWLPLSHSFGKMLEAVQIAAGFGSAVDGRIDKLVENLGKVRPTFVCAVPRIFEKVHNKVVETAKAGGALKWAIFQWAFGVGRRVSALVQQGRPPTGLLAIEFALADRLVFKKLRERFGGRLRFFISGSAPLSRYIAEFFHAAGILILEGYGLTESSAASFVNLPEHYKFGTVGPAVPGTEVRIAPEDGEILMRGRGIMRGYHNLAGPTREALTEDRWLRTGDIGELDGDGFLRITDRKKDLIKTSGGKYVAPQAIEGKLKALCPYVSQVVVHGDNRNFCSALVTIDEEAVRKWARENGLGDLSYAQLAANDRVRALVQGYFEQLNKQLASYETVKRFAILPADLTEAAGELTPSLKVKRKFVEQKYKAILEGFYAGALRDV